MIEMQEISKDGQQIWQVQVGKQKKDCLTFVFFSVTYIIGWYAGYKADMLLALSLIVGAYFGSRGIRTIWVFIAQIASKKI